MAEQVGRTSAAHELDDQFPDFRARRQRMLVDHVPESAVCDFLHSADGGALPRDEAALVARTIGGHFKDLHRIVQAVQQRGSEAAIIPGGGEAS